jgi:pimeloyl-ACP methyl ester carboxylesterase
VSESFGGDEFYAVPDPLPDGEPGTLLRYEPIDGVPIDGSAYRIMYLSESVAGEPIAVTGVAAVPSGASPEGGRLVFSGAHGSSGVADQCAASTDPYRITENAPALDAGYVVVYTDYEGLGMPGRHPILVGESEARSVLDAARAVRPLPDANASTSVALWGLSQGGHSALWAGQLAPEWAPELEVFGVIAAEPVTELEALFDSGREPEVFLRGVTVQLLAGYAAAYPEFDPSVVLTAAAEDQLDVVDRECFDGVIEHFAAGGRDDVLEPPRSVEQWTELLRANNPGQVRIDAPVLLLDSAGDTIIQPDLVDALYQRMCDLGQTVERHTFEFGDHAENYERELTRGVEWIEQQRAGTEPISTCPDR